MRIYFLYVTLLGHGTILAGGQLNCDASKPSGAVQLQGACGLRSELHTIAYLFDGGLGFSGLGYFSGLFLYKDPGFKLVLTSGLTQVSCKVSGLGHG